jgi:hypothetical protein
LKVFWPKKQFGPGLKKVYLLNHAPMINPEYGYEDDIGCWSSERAF